MQKLLHVLQQKVWTRVVEVVCTTFSSAISASTDSTTLAFATRLRVATEPARLRSGLQIPPRNEDDRESPQKELDGIASLQLPCCCCCSCPYALLLHATAPAIAECDDEMHAILPTSTKSTLLTPKKILTKHKLLKPNSSH